MAITVTSIVAGPFTATGAEQALPFTFKLFTPEECEVIVGDQIVGDRLVLGEDYEVNSNRSADDQVLEGGTVTIFEDAVASGQPVFVIAKPALTQEQVYTNSGTRISNLNEGLDRAAQRAIRAQYDGALEGAGEELLAAAAAAGAAAAQDVVLEDAIAAGAAAGTAAGEAASAGAAAAGAAAGTTAGTAAATAAVAGKANVNLDNASFALTDPAGAITVQRAPSLRGLETRNVADYAGASFTTKLQNAGLSLLDSGGGMMGLPVTGGAVVLEDYFRVPDDAHLYGLFATLGEGAGSGGPFQTKGLDTPGIMRIDQASGGEMQMGHRAKLSKVQLRPLALVEEYASAAAAIADFATWTGTGLLGGSVDINVEDVMIVGFNLAYQHIVGERLKMRGVRSDCTSGFIFEEIYDIPTLENLHCWPYLTAHRSWTPDNFFSMARAGVAYTLRGGNDWTSLKDSFAIGYQVGVDMVGPSPTNRPSHVSLDNVQVDHIEQLAKTETIGIRIGANCRATTIKNPRLAAVGIGIQQNTAGVVNVEGARIWGNQDAFVEQNAGTLNLKGGTFEPQTGFQNRMRFGDNIISANLELDPPNNPTILGTNLAKSKLNYTIKGIGTTEVLFQPRGPVTDIAYRSRGREAGATSNVDGSLVPFSFDRMEADSYASALLTVDGIPQPPNVNLETRFLRAMPTPDVSGYQKTTHLAYAVNNDPSNYGANRIRDVTPYCGIGIANAAISRAWGSNFIAVAGAGPGPRFLSAGEFEVRSFANTTDQPDQPLIFQTDSKYGLQILATNCMGTVGAFFGGSGEWFTNIRTFPETTNVNGYILQHGEFCIAASGPNAEGGVIGAGTVNPDRSGITGYHLFKNGEARNIIDIPDVSGGNGHAFTLHRTVGTTLPFAYSVGLRRTQADYVVAGGEGLSAGIIGSFSLVAGQGRFGIGGKPDVALDGGSFLWMANGSAPSVVTSGATLGSSSGELIYKTPTRTVNLTRPIQNFILKVGDETTPITTGVRKTTFRLPYDFKLTDIRASLNDPSSSGIPTIDVNDNGTSILSTKLTIDVGETSSATAAVGPTISDDTLLDNAEVTIDVDVSGTGATGLKVYLIGYKSS